MNKDVLVLPGGGAKGCVQLGMLDEYVRQYGYPSCVIGTSVGALNGSVVAGHDLDSLFRIWGQISSPKDIIKKRFLSYLLFWNKSSVYSAEPLEKLMEKELNLDKLRNSITDFYACAWNPHTLKSEIFSKHHPNIMQAILASASIPIIFNEVKINGRYYFDGGVTDQVPTRFIFSRDPYGIPYIKSEINRIVILNPSVKTPEPKYNEKFDRITKIAGRLIDGLTLEGKLNDTAMTIDRSRIANLEHRLSKYEPVENKGKKYSSIETWDCYPIRSHMETLDFYPSKIAQGIVIGRQSFKENMFVYSEGNNFQGELA